MKEEYIKREDAINIYCKNCGWREGQCDEDEGYWCEERSLLTKLPSADVVERKHGEWLITDPYPHNVYCSNCYKTFAQSHWAVWEDGTLPRSYCPNCGADMRGEKNNG